ncbi:MAG: ABC transporter permease [Alphaproteobacteria bacterium]|nr:ABC transporter permease [Alphaproteobacteria bacterium]
MTPGDLVATAARALRGNPLRSALTALGVIIGVASVVAMVALGRGAQERVQSSIASLGSNLVIVVPGAQRSGGVFLAQGATNTLTVADAEAIAREIDGIAAVAPSQRSGAQLVGQGVNWNTRVEGVTPPYLEVRDWKIAQGRMFDDREARQARKVVVLGQTVVDNMFPNVEPIGQRIRLSGGAYEVIGVLESKGQSGMGQDQDDIALAPLQTVKRRVAGRQGRADTVTSISIKAVSEEAVERVQEDVTALLRQRHRIQEGEADDFTVQNLNSIAATAQETTATFTTLIAAISAVSLLVGGIGIMNIMLVSVTERTREIGLRKALGARKGDILRQFGLEAVVLSCAGGVVGLVIGSLAAWGLTTAIDLPLLLGLDTGLIALGFSAAVGVIFGAYPAWRAAQLDPIEALRRE